MAYRPPIRTALTLALAAALLGPGLAGAADPAVPGNPGPAAPGPDKAWHRHGTRLQERLGLSDDQAQALRQVHQRQADSFRQHARALRQAQADLRRLAIVGTDEGALRARAADVQKLSAEGMELRLLHLREVSALLTPEQREKLAALDFRGGRRHHRFHRQAS